MNKQARDELIRKIERNKPVRLSKPRIKPLEGADLDQEMARFLNKSEWDKLVQKFFEEEKKNSGRPVRHVWATLIRYRSLAIPLNMFANQIFSNSSLPARDREILILRIAWLCYSEYAWGQHVQFVK